MKINLKKLHPSKAWTLIYPMYARLFLLGNDFNEFIAGIEQEFILTPEQKQNIKQEWDIKEEILK